MDRNTDWISFAENFRRPADANFGTMWCNSAPVTRLFLTYGCCNWAPRRILVHDIDPDSCRGFCRAINRISGTQAGIGRANSGPRGSPLPPVSSIARRSEWKSIPARPWPLNCCGRLYQVADIVYVPLRTQLLRLAEAAGCRTLAGGGAGGFPGGRSLSPVYRRGGGRRTYAPPIPARFDGGTRRGPSGNNMAICSCSPSDGIPTASGSHSLSTQDGRRKESPLTRTGLVCPVRASGRGFFCGGPPFLSQNGNRHWEDSIWVYGSFTRSLAGGRGWLCRLVKTGTVL